MSERLAVFRAEASPDIGGGHIVRSLALADGLAARGWRCVFACESRTQDVVPALADSRHRILTLEPAEPEREAAAIGTALGGRVDWLVVDHYGRDAAFHNRCRQWARQVLVVDELADRSIDADILTDPTPARSSADYEARVPAHCVLLLGPAYALLRPEFVVARPAALGRREEHRGLERLLVSCGSVDAANRTSLALAGIRESGLRPEVDVVLGAAAPHAAAVHELVESLPFPVTVHRATEDMPRLMAAADLAIGAAGATSWERCCLGLPALVLVDADNQRRFATELAAAGAGVHLGAADSVTPDTIATALHELATAPTGLVAMSAAAARLCDGEGVVRVVERMTANP